MSVGEYIKQLLVRMRTPKAKLAARALFTAEPKDFGEAAPAEWTRIDPDYCQPGTWQSRRIASVFSRDGGLTCYDIDDRRTFYTCHGCETNFPISHDWLGPSACFCCSQECSDNLVAKYNSAREEMERYDD